MKLWEEMTTRERYIFCYNARKAWHESSLFNFPNDLGKSRDQLENSQNHKLVKSCNGVEE